MISSLEDVALCRHQAVPITHFRHFLPFELGYPGFRCRSHDIPLVNKYPIQFFFTQSDWIDNTTWEVRHNDHVTQRILHSKG